MSDIEKYRAVNIPRVRVLYENGDEMLRGYYVLHFNRTPNSVDDGYNEEDVEHLVISDDTSDWGMPRGLQVTRVAPPCTIELIEE